MTLLRCAYFLNLPGEEDDASLELAFSKRKVEERKAWLAGFVPGTYLDQSVDEISYSDFVNKACLWRLGRRVLLQQALVLLAVALASTTTALVCMISKHMRVTLSHIPALSAQCHSALSQCQTAPVEAIAVHAGSFSSQS
jgi:hypothetical protein